MQIECAKCGCRHVFVKWTRHTIRGITRKRECRNCGYRFATREIIENKEKKVTDV